MLIFFDIYITIGLLITMWVMSEVGISDRVQQVSLKDPHVSLTKIQIWLVVLLVVLSLVWPIVLLRKKN